MRAVARSLGDWLIDQALAVVNAGAALKWRDRIRMAEQARYQALTGEADALRRCPGCRRRYEDVR